MPLPSIVKTSDYQYILPPERIALYPLDPRDSSKLLVYRNGIIHDSTFVDLHSVISEKTLLVANDTSVVNARLIFRTPDNSRVEIFLLEPPEKKWQSALLDRSGTMEFHALIGNKRKWKTEALSQVNVHENAIHQLKVTLLNHEPPFRIRLNWSPQTLTLADIIDEFGKVPLPPYIRRDAEESDKETYQTVYASQAGSVAAPTAGLHFTPRVLDSLREKQCDFTQITLHVGAGTFKPVTSENALEHEMHAEEFSVSFQTLAKIRHQLNAAKPIAAVGTTTLRTLESLYAVGVQILNGIDISNGFEVAQFELYYYRDIDPLEVIEALMNEARKSQDQKLHGKTRLMIVPGFEFKLADILITNFHQPSSTLLMLVAAFIGNDWKKVYEHALENDYRFLSYGDSSILFR